MDTSEELREALLDLEEARKKEKIHRQMAEVLLEGLRVLVVSQDPHELFSRIFEVMKKPLDFEAAFVLLENKEGLFIPMIASSNLFYQTVWKPKAMLKRVIQGQPVAVFDTDLVEEWNDQPEKIRNAVRSALHFSIHTSGRNAIMVCTHPNHAHFSKHHVMLARRFSILAAQALQKMEAEQRVAALEQRLDSEARIAEMNRRLAENERKLASARKMEAVGLLAGGVAHDLNNILSGIVTYPELLLMDEKLLPEHKRAIQTIRESGLRAVAVVEDLLTVARGAASLSEPLNLNKIINSYLISPEYQRLSQITSRVTVKTQLANDLLNISGSNIHISKALMNLVHNAAEAVQEFPEKCIVVKTANQYLDTPIGNYSEVREGEYAVLSVRDNGSGISPADLERIFEPFYTKKAMGRSGTGLGLAIVWNVMKDHGGYVDVKSDENGTEFRLYFPSLRNILLEEKTGHRLEEFLGQGETVLVVDDLEDQRNIACAILTKLGYKAASAPSGEMALEYLKKNSADIIILDMIMDPGMNGLETYRKVIEIRPGQKAIIASGYSMSEDVAAAQNLGAGPFIKKPYTLARLGQALKAASTAAGN
ncbi:MAG: response regulator [Deltaproteobacteria bacterium]|nr:response regulator [Deltaproteobacteria bacterium]